MSGVRKISRCGIVQTAEYEKRRQRRLAREKREWDAQHGEVRRLSPESLRREPRMVPVREHVEAGSRLDTGRSKQRR